MQEKTIIKSRLYSTKPFVVLTFCLTVFVDFIIFLFYYSDNKKQTDDWNWHWDWVVEKYGENATVFEVTIHDFRYVIPISILIALGIIALYLICYKKINLVVTDKRVYGRVFWGKRVDLPIDAISAVATSIFKSIAIASSSGKIKFLGIANRDDIYEKINALLINRQHNRQRAGYDNDYDYEDQAINVKNSARNNIDELKELKELLDQGIITQEDFDTKKKQILGL